MAKTVKTKDEKILELPKDVYEYAMRYFNLNIGGKKVACPYYMNLKRAKDLRVMVGKGTPEEIELESTIWAKLRGVDLDKMSTQQIREFLVNQDIGIDCSGFVMHVMNYWYKTKKGKNIWSKMKIYNKSIFHKIAYILKPVQKLGAEIITSELNATKVELKNVKPGDLIRSKWKRKNSHHVLLVSKVYKSKIRGVTKIEYIGSSEYYGANSGARIGYIEIKDDKKPLEKAKWVDFDENGVNHIYEGFLYQLEDNGLRRLKCMSEIQ